MFNMPVLVSGNTSEKLGRTVNFVANVLMGTVETRTSESGYNYGMAHYVDMNAGREVTLFFQTEELDRWQVLEQGKFYELHFAVRPGRRGYEFFLQDNRELNL